MRDECQALARIHTRVSDAISGYQELGRRGLGSTVPLAAAMAELHQRHRDSLLGMLSSRGCEPAPDGGFMALLHEGVMRPRDWIDDLDDDLPARLRDAEERIVGLYDEAIDAMRDSVPERFALAGQRGELTTRIAEVEKRAA